MAKIKPKKRGSKVTSIERESIHSIALNGFACRLSILDVGYGTVGPSFFLHLPKTTNVMQNAAPGTWGKANGMGLPTGGRTW